MERDRDLAEALNALRARCERAGLPAWRCDLSGHVTDDPQVSGLAGLFLNSSAVSAEIASAAAGWNGAEQPPVSTVLGGASLIAFPETRRRRCVGYLAVLALGPTALGSARFREACVAVSLDPGAVRRALAPFAKWDPAGVPALREMLRSTADDLGRISESRRTIDGFTNQLSDSFETISLLYGMGKLMNDLSRPEELVRGAVEKIAEATRFGVVAAILRPFEGASEQHEVVGSADPALLSAIADQPAGDEAASSRIVSEALIAPGVTRQTAVIPIRRHGKTAGHLIVSDKVGDDPQISSYDTQLGEAASAYIGAFLENAALFRRQREMFMASIEALANAIDAKDPYTCGHSRRVAMLSHRIALAMGMSAEQAERVRISGLVHDVGKIGVPEAVLCKPGRLTDDEFAAIKLHPEIGHRILRAIPLMEDILPGVLSHHERWDGRGYPHGLAGEGIPLIARIIGCADTFDAMSSTRSYRPALPREAVIEELARSAGKQLDASVVEAFRTIDLTEYDGMVAEDHARQAAAQRQIDAANASSPDQNAARKAA